MYKVTKKFITGPLKGLVLTEITSVRFVTGEKISGIGGGKYEIVGCVEC